MQALQDCQPCMHAWASVLSMKTALALETGQFLQPYQRYHVEHKQPALCVPQALSVHLFSAGASSSAWNARAVMAASSRCAPSCVRHATGMITCVRRSKQNRLGAGLLSWGCHTKAAPQAVYSSQFGTRQCMATKRKQAASYSSTSPYLGALP